MKLLKKGLKIYGIMTLVSMAIYGLMQYIASIIRVQRRVKKNDFDGMIEETMRLGCVDIFAKD